MEEQKKQINISFSKIFGFMIIALIIYILILLYIFYIERTIINLTLLGQENVILEVGQEYIEEGFIARSNKNDMHDKVIITSNVNTKEPGKYEILYNLKVDHLCVNKKISRNIYVKDTTKPDLKIDSEKEKTIYIGNKYSYPTYTAIDNYDGDITKNVKVESNLNLEKEGTYEIKYFVSDSSGNETLDNIIIHVKKNKNPYVVVSISNQTLKYYEYGELVLSSDVVTGINGKTPIGNFKVLNKARNIILKGKDYESFVSYWIAFKGVAFGFHDASWRSKFGGTIYKYNGSHGCVNMPYNKVKSLYNMISIGTPVYIKK